MFMWTQQKYIYFQLSLLYHHEPNIILHYPIIIPQLSYNITSHQSLMLAQ